MSLNALTQEGPVEIELPFGAGREVYRRRCSRSIALLSMFLIFFFSAGLAQLVETTPPPPAHLPRLISECEAGTNYNACSVWIWHGTSYSAIWPNGAVAQLKVASGNAQPLRIERQDSAGPLLGLTAIYTGQWDGKAFSDGKMVATLKGGSNSLTWTATPAVTPVLSSPTYSYVNWYTSQLTGYAIFNSQGSFNSSVGTEIDDYRVRGEQPMNPGESRPFTQRYVVVPASYAKGVTYPQAASIAAIYADGTTFGDANVLKVMMERRKLMLTAVTSIGGTLCTMAQRSASLAEVSSALDKQQAAEDARSATGKEERAVEYSRIQKELPHMMKGHLPPSRAILQIWDQVNKMRSGLAADPVKDAAGNLLISPVKPLVCNMP